MSDLGGLYEVVEIVIFWENAYARNFTVEMSSAHDKKASELGVDPKHWTVLHCEEKGQGGVSLCPVYSVGRHVRMHGTRRKVCVALFALNWHCLPSTNQTCTGRTTIGATRCSACWCSH